MVVFQAVFGEQEGVANCNKWQPDTNRTCFLIGKAGGLPGACTAPPLPPLPSFLILPWDTEHNLSNCTCHPPLVPGTEHSAHDHGPSRETYLDEGHEEPEASTSSSRHWPH